MTGSETANDRWLPAWLAVLATIVFLCPLWLDFPLLDPDEGLHAAIAQEMVERGDWVIPSLLGKPFLDKPILYFWAQALSLRTFGMSEAAVRLPGLLFGLLGAVTTAIVGWRMCGRTIGLVAGVFYTTMILPVAFAQAAVHDVALIPWLNLSMLLFWESDRLSSRRARAGCTVALGVLLGLSVLTKGLVGVALVGLTYGAYLLLRGQLTLAACVRGAAALLLAAAVASTWYIAVELRNPGYLYYYFVERHLLGFATDTQAHGGEPWWYYLPILLGGSLPWIAYLPVTVCDDWVRRKAEGSGFRVQGSGFRLLRLAVGLARRCREVLSRPDSSGATVLLWCWLIGCTLLLSLSHSKLVTYIWPVFPAVAILAAIGWGRLIAGTLTARARRLLVQTLVGSCVGGPVVLPVALLVVQGEFNVRFSPLAWTAAAAAAAGALVPLVFVFVGRMRGALGSALFAATAQFAVVMIVVLPQVAPAASARDLADHFNRLGRLPPELLVAEERVGSLVFYLQSDLRAGLQARQVRQVRLKNFPPTEPGALMVLSESSLHRLRRHLDLDGLVYESTAGHRIYNAADFAEHSLKTATNQGDTLRR